MTSPGARRQLASELITERARVLDHARRAARRGEFATTGPELENLLQRAATPGRSILEGLTTQS